MKSLYKTISDDGYNSKLAKNAIFSGIFEFPTIRKNECLIIPQKLVPYSKIKYEDSSNSFLMFYEWDKNFIDLLNDIESNLDNIKKFKGVITPDCSLFRNMPLSLQISNTYINRLIGHYLQENGVYIIPQVRWGDERSYTSLMFKEKFSFTGLPQKSILAISTYGCIKGTNNKYHFREGLRNMILELHPKIIIVYGSMPDNIFAEFLHLANFINYPDYISIKKGK